MCISIYRDSHWRDIECMEFWDSIRHICISVLLSLYRYSSIVQIFNKSSSDAIHISEWLYSMNCMIRSKLSVGRVRSTTQIQTWSKHQSSSLQRVAGMKRLKTEISMDSVQLHSESFSVAGLNVTNGQVSVPLDYTGRVQDTITVFYRVITARNKNSQSLPYLLYLQGKGLVRIMCLSG